VATISDILEPPSVLPSYHPNRRSRAWSIAIAAAAATLFVLVDELAQFQINLTPFYLLSILVVGWTCGFGYAMTFAFAITGAIVALSLHFVPHALSSEFFYMDLTSNLFTFGLVGFFISRLRNMLAHETKTARTDALTGIANRAMFYGVLGSELERHRRYGRPFSVVFIDVDDFKLINDGPGGHAAGDDVLRGVANTLSDTVRASDLPARVGGDEFVIFLPETGATNTRLVTDKVHLRLRELPSIHGRQPTFSIGAAVFNNAPPSVDVIVSTADKLMYTVKRTGKDRVHLEVY